METLLTAEEVCDKLRMTAKSRTVILGHWVAEGRIRAIRVGKSLRFRERDVEAYLKSRETR